MFRAKHYTYQVRILTIEQLLQLYTKLPQWWTGVKGRFREEGSCKVRVIGSIKVKLLTAYTRMEWLQKVNRRSSKWTATRTRGGGRYKRQGGIQQQEVVRIRNLIKWSTPLTRMANSSDTTNQGGKMERNYKDEDSTPRMNRLEIKEMEYMRFKTTQTEVQQLWI